MKIPGLRFRNSPMIGLDIGSSSVKAVEIVDRGSDKGFELKSLGVAQLSPDAIVQGAFLDSEAIVTGIREALDQGGIVGENVAVAVAGHSVIVKKVSLSRQTRDELEEALQWEAEQYIPFDVNEVHLDFQILDSSDIDGQMDVLLVAAKKDLVDDYVRVISKAGLKATCIDVASFAISNAFEANYGLSDDESIALVNIGAQVVNINVVQGRVPAFTRDITVGGNQFTEEIQRSLSMEFQEAEKIKLGESADQGSREVIPQEVDQAVAQVTQEVVDEIGRSLDFFSATSADSRIERVVLCGGGAKVPGFVEAFAKRTGLAIERMNPLARMLPQRKFDADYLEEVGASLGVGVGLAMRRGIH